MIVKRTEAERKWIDDCILYRAPKEAKEETEHIIEESKLAETYKKINRIRKNEIWKKFFEIKRECSILKLRKEKVKEESVDKGHKSKEEGRCNDISESNQDIELTEIKEEELMEKRKRKIKTEGKEGEIRIFINERKENTIQENEIKEI
jgi:hypothetical protein